jgi:hypothetical protein
MMQHKTQLSEAATRLDGRLKDLDVMIESLVATVGRRLLARTSIQRKQILAGK